MKWSLLALLCVTAVACNNASVRSCPPATDFNDDGKIGFSDLERGRPPEPMTDFHRNFRDHMQKQDPRYDDR